MGWDDFIRMVNALGCVFGLSILSVSSYRHWREWNSKTKAYWWAFFGFIFLGFEGSLEAIVLGTRPGPRLFLHTIVIGWTIRVLLMQGDITMKPELPWKKDKKNEA